MDNMNIAKKTWYLFFSEDLFQVLKHDSLNGMDHHPQSGQSLSNQFLTSVFWMTHVKHDVANDVIIESKCCLRWKFGDESNQSTQYLEHLSWAVTR